MEPRETPVSVSNFKAWANEAPDQCVDISEGSKKWLSRTEGKKWELSANTEFLVPGGGPSISDFNYNVLSTGNIYDVDDSTTLSVIETNLATKSHAALQSAAAELLEDYANGAVCKYKLLSFGNTASIIKSTFTGKLLILARATNDRLTYSGAGVFDVVEGQDYIYYAPFWINPDSQSKFLDPIATRMFSFKPTVFSTPDQFEKNFLTEGDCLLTSDHIFREEPEDLSVYERGGKLAVSEDVVKQIVQDNIPEIEIPEGPTDPVQIEDPLILFNALGELEGLEDHEEGLLEISEYQIQFGSFINAGSGWNTFYFPKPFDNPPIVFAELDVSGSYKVLTANIYRDRFQYYVQEHYPQAQYYSTLYAFNRNSISSTYMQAYNNILCTPLLSASRGVDTAWPINYIAIAKRGEIKHD